MSDIVIVPAYDQQTTSINADGSFRAFSEVFIVEGVADEVEAMRELIDVAPSEKHGLPLSYLEIDAREREDIYRVSVVYESNANEENQSNDDASDEEPRISFDCGGGTRHVENSLNQQHIYGDRDAGGLVNWNGKTGAEFDVRGVEVPAAQLQETYTKTMKLADLSTGFKRKVASLVGKVNAQNFHGWEPGEVLFLGCSFAGENKKSATVEVSFNFSIQLNEKNVTVAGQTFSKKGFEYVWVITQPVLVSGRPKATVTDIYVDQVVGYANFAELGV